MVATHKCCGLLAWTDYLLSRSFDGIEAALGSFVGTATAAIAEATPEAMPHPLLPAVCHQSNFLQWYD